MNKFKLGKYLKCTSFFNFSFAKVQVKGGVIFKKIFQVKSANNLQST